MSVHSLQSALPDLEANPALEERSDFPTFAFSSLAFRTSRRPTVIQQVASSLHDDERSIPIPTEKLASEPTPRARDADGRDFHTACFGRDHLTRAHHHRLICGHDVMTAGIEVCGSNCMLSKKAESKARNRPFACPDPGCKAKTKALLPSRKRDAAGHFVRQGGRVCTLSHVYSLDRAEDAARVAEKENVKVEREGPKAVRKRSVSPDEGLADNARLRRPRLVRPDTVSREAAALLRGSGVLKLMKAMGTSHTRQLRGDRLETKLEYVENIINMAKNKSERTAKNGKPSRFFKETSNLATENDSADTIQDGDFPEHADDADLFCVCRTTASEFLVLCERCEHGFRPGCIGEGKWAIADYEDDKPGQEFNFKSDFNKIMKEGHRGIFHCPDCKATVASALQNFESGIGQTRTAAGATGEKLEDDAIEDILASMQNTVRPSSSGMKRKAEEVSDDAEAEADGVDIEMMDATLGGEEIPHDKRHRRTSNKAKSSFAQIRGLGRYRKLGGLGDTRRAFM